MIGLTPSTGSDGQSGAGARAAELVRIEAQALHTLALRLDGPAAQAFELVLAKLTQTVQNGQRIVLCGIGKSGLIARKIAATLISLGVPAIFLHPAEALHGDLGLLLAGDALLMLSYSGETEELLRLLPLVRRLGVSVLSLCGCADSTLARGSEIVLDISVDREACAHQLAPTASTTVMLALGDALAVELSRQLGFAPQSFAELHPGGQLGRRLAPVRDLMHTGDALPVVAADAAMPEIMHEMSAKRLGMTTVQRDGVLLGVLSDGDLRRLMERDGPKAFHKRAAEVMNPSPRTVSDDVFVSDALVLMEEYKITSLVVRGREEQSRQVLGIVHMHDLLESLVATKSG